MTLLQHSTLVRGDTARRLQFGDLSYHTQEQATSDEQLQGVALLIEKEKNIVSLSSLQSGCVSNYFTASLPPLSEAAIVNDLSSPQFNWLFDDADSEENTLVHAAARRAVPLPCRRPGHVAALFFHALAARG